MPRSERLRFDCDPEPSCLAVRSFKEKKMRRKADERASSLDKYAPFGARGAKEYAS